MNVNVAGNNAGIVASNIPTAFSGSTPDVLRAVNGHNDAIRLTFDCGEAFTQVACVRQIARSVINRLGIGREDAAILELLIGELVSNAVRHAPGGSYRTEIELRKDYAEIRVRDEGAGFSPGELLAPGTLRREELSPSDTTRIGGFGLPLVYSLADEVEISRNSSRGTTVRARKILHQ